MANSWKAPLQIISIAVAALGWFLVYRSQVEISRLRLATAEGLIKDKPSDKNSPSSLKTPASEAQQGTKNETKSVEVKRGNQFNELWRSQPKYSPKRRNRTFQREVEQDFSPLIKQFSLTPEVQAKLKSLLVERKHLIMDVRDVANQKGERTTGFALVAAAEAAAPVDSEIETLLGTDKYGIIKSSLNNGLELGQIKNGWSLDLSYAGRALNPMQEVKLAEILHTATAPNNGTSSNRASQADPELSEVDERVLAEASQFLSQDQIMIIKQAIIERRIVDGNPL